MTRSKHHHYVTQKFIFRKSRLNNIQKKLSTCSYHVLSIDKDKTICLTFTKILYPPHSSRDFPIKVHIVSLPAASIINCVKSIRCFMIPLLLLEDEGVRGIGRKGDKQYQVSKRKSNIITSDSHTIVFLIFISCMTNSTIIFSLFQLSEKVMYQSSISSG